MYSLNLKYNPRIDQLRWLAATIVFLFHFQLEYRGLGGPALKTHWAGLITEGHTGVGLFFTLSGFLFMQIALVQKTIVYGEFVRNRVLRIVPLFLTIFLVAVSIGRDKFQPQDLLFFFASNLGMPPTSGSPVTGAAWTVSFEFMFYLMFPFLARFSIERGPRYLVNLLVLMVFFKLAAYTVNANSELMYFSTFIGRFDQFLIGMLAAMFQQRHAQTLHRHAVWLVPLAALLAVCALALLSRLAPFGGSPKSPYWVAWPTVESAVWAIFILAWTSFQPRLSAWLEQSLCHIGKVSFSFYLLHMGLLHLLGQWTGLVHPTGNGCADAAIMIVVCYGAACALATLCYNTVEEPFLRMRHRYGVQQATSSSVSDC